MDRLAPVAISVLLASCLATGQAQAPNAPIQTGAAIANQRSQTDNGTGEIPKFYAHGRQVLVTVSVWKHAPKTVPEQVLKRYPDASDLAAPPVARGLSANDFRVYDNGAEQRINYVEEFDLPWRDVDRQWHFYPRVRGTWGNFLSSAIGQPVAMYVIGYIPPLSRSGPCHTFRVVAGDNDVVMNRTRYCDNDESDTATVAGGELAAQAKSFAKSGKSGSISVSSRPFVFWSSRVLSLIRDNAAGSGSASALAGKPTYVVVVHDSKAPATVQVATEYELMPVTSWDYPCPRDHPAIYVFGFIYKPNGEVAARFGDTYSCLELGDYQVRLPVEGRGWSSIEIPTRFNTQVELRPGDYDLHVVVSDGHRWGQAQMPLRVELIDSHALTVSDIASNGVLRDASSLLPDAALVSPAPLMPSPLVSQQSQFIPVPEARIRQRSPLPLYFEIYEPLLADRNPEVYYRMRITDLKDGTLVVNTGPTSAAQQVTPRNAVVPVSLKIDTAELPSGSYKIEIQASDSAGRTTEWRMAKFEIQ